MSFTQLDLSQDWQIGESFRWPRCWLKNIQETKKKKKMLINFNTSCICFWITLSFSTGDKRDKIIRFLTDNQFSSVAQSCLTLCNPMDWSTPGLPVITNSQRPLKLMSIESVMPSNHLILCRPLLLLPSILPSIGVFSNESVLHIRWPKYWSFSFSISPSDVYSGLISFTMGWLDLLAIQVTLKSLLQHHSSKALVLQCSAFFIVQFSHHTWLLEKP